MAHFFLYAFILPNINLMHTRWAYLTVKQLKGESIGNALVHHENIVKNATYRNMKFHRNFYRQIYHY